VNAIAGSQRTRACIDKVISTNACSVPLSQPPLNFFNSVSFKDPYSFCASHRRILAGKDATGDPPENQLWMGLEKARWRGRVIQFPQFIPNAKQLHGDSATDSLPAPIVKVSFIKRLEIPDAAPRAEKNARSDQRSGFDIALPVSPLRQPDRHIDHGAIIGIGQKSRCGFRVRKALASVAAKIDRDPSSGNAIHANEGFHVTVSIIF
jgi:hypothetical protein